MQRRLCNLLLLISSKAAGITPIKDLNTVVFANELSAKSAHHSQHHVRWESKQYCHMGVIMSTHQVIEAAACCGSLHDNF